MARLQDESVKPSLFFHPDAKTPSREQQLSNLYSGSSESPFDVLIIGGGATGSGIAVDAATRWAYASKNLTFCLGACNGCESAEPYQRVGHHSHAVSLAYPS